MLCYASCEIRASHFDYQLTLHIIACILDFNPSLISGFYRVRARDYWNIPGPYSETVPHELT